MKDNLIEILFNLFEQSLTQIQKSHENHPEKIEDLDDETELGKSLFISNPQERSTRVMAEAEQIKLSKASQQFLMRMRLLNIIDADFFEVLLTQLQFSDSRIVSLQETKWTIRNLLATELSEEQLAFLDLVLYQSEDAYTIH